MIDSNIYLISLLIIIIFILYFYFEYKIKKKEPFFATKIESKMSANSNNPKKYLNTMDKNQTLFLSFCKKLNMLNKPSDSNLIFKKFTKEAKENKIKQIEKLKSMIENLQSDMFSDKINSYNSNRLRTHENAQKQIKAIKKAQDNIKNRNKIKINLI